MYHHLIDPGGVYVLRHGLGVFWPMAVLAPARQGRPDVCGSLLLLLFTAPRARALGNGKLGALLPAMLITPDTLNQLLPYDMKLGEQNL